MTLLKCVFLYSSIPLHPKTRWKSSHDKIPFCYTFYSCLLLPFLSPPFCKTPLYWPINFILKIQNSFLWRDSGKAGSFALFARGMRLWILSSELFVSCHIINRFVMICDWLDVARQNKTNHPKTSCFPSHLFNIDWILPKCQIDYSPEKPSLLF